MKHVENCFLCEGYIVAFGPSYNQERSITPSGLLCIREVAYSYFGVFLWSIYQVSQKVATFKWGPEQGKALQQVLAAVQTAVPLGLYYPAYSMVLKAGRDNL